VQASEYLAIISDVERANVLRKYHAADARMSLASALLKRVYVAKATGIPWAEIRFSRRPGKLLHSATRRASILTCSPFQIKFMVNRAGKCAFRYSIAPDLIGQQGTTSISSSQRRLAST
jgi:hypothetical protein